jgi:parvulin-like peptidyl-prolyl isomerase
MSQCSLTAFSVNLLQRMSCLHSPLKIVQNIDPVTVSTNVLMMESQAFITVDDQSISIEQAVKYLQSCGKWNSVLWDILCEYVIEQELQIQDQWTVDTFALEQTIINFRLKYQLGDQTVFEEWLQGEGLDYSTFSSQMMSNIKISRLKENVAKPKLQEYFIERKIFLDQVILSRLAVDNLALAEELKSQVLEDGIEFEQLVNDYSLEDRMLNGMLEPISRGTMPDKLRTAVDLAKPGEIIGPIELDELWFLVRIEKILPAELDESLQQKLEDELFEQWLEEKIQTKTVKVQVT